MDRVKMRGNKEGAIETLSDRTGKSDTRIEKRKR